jgi:hypothetical protein
MVAMDEERVMGKNIRAHRAKVLKIARALARSGQHPNHKSIIAEMEPLDAGVRKGLQDIRLQLDRLCALAQAGRARIEIPGRNQPTAQCR